MSVISMYSSALMSPRQALVSASNDDGEEGESDWPNSLSPPSVEAEAIVWASIALTRSRATSKHFIASAVCSGRHKSRHPHPLLAHKQLMYLRCIGPYPLFQGYRTEDSEPNMYP